MNADTIGGLVILLMFLGLLVAVSFGIYDGLYVRPIASDGANNYCKDMGFDQYKTYSRVGIFSKNPVAIKCEFAEKYTDLGVRAN